MHPIQDADMPPLIGDAAATVDSVCAPWPAATAPGRDSPKAGRIRLTPRQLEVLALLCEGHSNKLICQRLNIAVGTVRVHIGHILRELGVSNRLQAVVSAFRLGLVRAAVGRDAKRRGSTPQSRSWGIQHKGDSRT
jgi:DNA-binding CsgD family transcriptional regulator